VSAAGCLFCELVRSGSHVRRADGFVAVEDVNPKAEVHILVVPERHIDTFRQIGEFPPEEALRMLEFIADTAAVEDVNPKAEVHILVVPERHIDTFRQIGEFPPEEALRMLEFIADTARELRLDDYRVLCTVGPSAGQTVFHLHWHLLGGRDLAGQMPALALAEAERED